MAEALQAKCCWSWVFVEEEVLVNHYLTKTNLSPVLIDNINYYDLFLLSFLIPFTEVSNKPKEQQTDPVSHRVLFAVQCGRSQQSRWHHNGTPGCGSGLPSLSNVSSSSSSMSTANHWWTCCHQCCHAEAGCMYTQSRQPYSIKYRKLTRFLCSTSCGSVV